ncbi:MAG: glycosyltransferase family 9 protein [Planctomycetota bacterium]
MNDPAAEIDETAPADGSENATEQKPGVDRLPIGGSLLVVRLSALGDVLFALETVSSLKHERPDVDVDFLVEDRFASALADHPLIREVVTIPRRGTSRYLRALADLRKRRYDVLLDLHGLLKSSLPILAIRAKSKIGFAPPAAREGSHRVLDHAVELPDPLPHRAARGAFLLAELGLSGAERPAVLRAQPKLPDPFQPNPAGRARVVLHPGTSEFAAFKRWPARHFRELATRLAAKDRDVYVGFGPGEDELALEILDHAEGLHALDGRDLGLDGYTEALRRADVVVAADTGPLHLASAAGTKVVALFGPKDHHLYGPRGDGNEILWNEVPCRPCKRRRCVTPQCILGLGVDRVEAAVERVLRRVTAAG